MGIVSLQDSIVSGSAALTPAAGTSICAITVLVPGIYEVQANIMITGTAETQINNGTLAIPGAGASGQILSVPTLTGVMFDFIIPRIAIQRAGTIAFKNTLIATAGAVYAAYLTATRIA